MKINPFIILAVIIVLSVALMVLSASKKIHPLIMLAVIIVLIVALVLWSAFWKINPFENNRSRLRDV